MEEIEAPSVGHHESLVAQDIADISVKIAARFNETGQAAISSRDCPSLLETSEYSFILAVDEMKLLDGTGFSSWYVASLALRNNSGIKFDETTVQQINLHPYIRTFSSVKVAELLDVRHLDMSEIAKELGIDPVVKRRLASEKWVISYERFNKDQILQLKQAIVKLNAPSNYVSQEKLLAATRLSLSIVKKICAELEIPAEWYRSSETGMSDVYFSPEQAGQIISYVRDKRSKAQ